MEDDKIRDLFKSFEPELSPDSKFMTRLKRKMESVEMVKQHTAALRRRSRIAVAVAAIVGFAVGGVMSIFVPVIADFFSSIKFVFPVMTPTPVTVDGSIPAWIVVSAVCALAAFNAYELTVSRQGS